MGAFDLNAGNQGGDSFAGEFGTHVGSFGTFGGNTGVNFGTIGADDPLSTNAIIKTGIISITVLLAVLGYISTKKRRRQ